ncbi:Hypothetical protein SCF082_LOCUS40444 [Durusdinium trenchii]|uniref:EF-hand domain-containing protein n=1 Tax=Durusdinium trenchii TaxID=1381693 RepID=A0ABP0QBQ1_9DINO
MASLRRSASARSAPWSRLDRASLASSGLFTETLTSQRGSSRWSSRTRSSSLSPKSKGHGRSYSPRRFASRHVPTAAEELAQSQHLEPSIIKRFDGLMKHLKRNTEKQDFEKQVLASPLEVLVPEEFDEVLRETFARHCSYGERLNTELMHSSKWIKMLKELDLMPAVATSPKRPCLASWADADLIFQRVLHDVDYGGKRLTYEDFCKALCLVAVNVHPDLSDWEAAMQELLTRIASVAERVRPSQADALEDDFSLDPNVLLVLEHFKPKLHDLFRSFARRQLPNPADAPVGTGTTRLKERSVWRTQDTFASKASTMAQTSTGEQISEQSTELPHQVDGSPRRGKPMTPKASSVKLPAEALKAVAEKGIENVAESLLGSSELTAWAESLGYFSPSSKSATGSRAGQWSPVSTDPYCYASGSPTMKNRQSFLSLEQLFSLCKELKIMPEVISRQAVVRIFKRAQSAGLQSAHQGSNYGFLSREAFVDAIGRIGIHAYSQPPYCDEHVEPHEKLQAFLFDRLPEEIRTVRDRFLYGCSGRGPAVPPGYMASVRSA